MHPRPCTRISFLLLLLPLVATAFLAIETATTYPARATPLPRERTPVQPGVPFRAHLPAPAGADFYNAPLVLPGRPGDVIWTMPSPEPVIDVFGVQTPRTALPVYNRPTGLMTPEVHRVLYHSTDQQGRSVPAYALVVLDPQRQPDAPMLAAMHGWTGFGDHCGLLRGGSRGSLVAAPNLIHHYVSRGYTLVLPDGPGMAGRGTPTPMIHLDAARNLLDAAHSAQLLTGTNGRVVFQGHSLGGMMVLGVPSEAPTYTPDMRIAGILSLAGVGYGGPGTPSWLAASSSDVTALVIYALMLEQSYDGQIDVKAHLTPRGHKRLRQIENLCGYTIGGYLNIDRFDEIFKPSFLPMVQRTIREVPAGPAVPLHVVTPYADSVVSSLPHQHAYLRRCRSGLPSFSTVVESSHNTVLSASHEHPAVRTWTLTVLSGGDVGPGCAPLDRTLNVGYAYTAAQLLATFADTTVTGELRIATAGNCRVIRKMLAVDLAGRCAFSISEVIPGKIGKGQAGKGKRGKDKVIRTWSFEAGIL